MNYLWSREQKWYRVNTTFSLSSRKTEIAISVRGRKLRGLLAEDAPVQSCPELNILVILKSADHKDLSEGCESRKFHRYAVVVFRLRYSVDTIMPMENTNFSGNAKEFTTVLGADEETKSHLHWQFLGIWQGLWRNNMESLYVYTTQIRNKWDCWKSSAQNKRRHLCRIVAIRSLWKLVGRFHGMFFLSSEH